jgi:hypothetical protein
MKNTGQIIEEYNNFKFISSCIFLAGAGALVWVFISVALSIL